MAKQRTMTPEEAVLSLSGLTDRLDILRANLGREVKTVESQWAALGRMGATRADAAADLLGKLVDHLNEIGGFCTRACELIQGFKADPFQE